MITKDKNVLMVNHILPTSSIKKYVENSEEILHVDMGSLEG